MNTTLLAVAVGITAVTAIALTAKKKENNTLRVGLNPNDIRIRSPGQPTQNINYIRGLQFNPNG